MLGHDHFYFNMTRKYIVAFAKLFDDIHIKRYDGDDIEIKDIKVPINYAGKQKVIQVRQKADIGIGISTFLPRMSFLITNIVPDALRKESNLQEYNLKIDGVDETLIHSGKPYDFNFTMTIWAEYMNDILQIIEQIGSFFKPDYSLTIKEIPAFDITRTIPVILDEISDISELVFDEESMRNVMYDLEFTLKGHFYPPITDGKLIQYIDMNLNDFETMATLTKIEHDYDELTKITTTTKTNPSE